MEQVIPKDHLGTRNINGSSFMDLDARRKIHVTQRQSKSAEAVVAEALGVVDTSQTNKNLQRLEMKYWECDYSETDYIDST